MQNIKLNPQHILGNSYVANIPNMVACLVVRRKMKSSKILENRILMLCSALSLLRYFIFVAAYFENALSHMYVDMETE
jgi:hypothetical protein